jgi:hypothetical protein
MEAGRWGAHARRMLAMAPSLHFAGLSDTRMCAAKRRKPDAGALALRGISRALRQLQVVTER